MSARTALFVGALSILVACTSGPEVTATRDAGPDLTISMAEWSFGPTTISVDEGASVNLRIRNDGALLHDWAVLSTPIGTENDLRPDHILVSARVEPGATEVLEFTPPAAGTYQVICSISGHFSQGMEGTLIVSP